MPYLYVPAGSYDAGRTLNVGENRWKFDLQLGGVQQLGNGFATQLSADAMWYGDNDDATGIGTVPPQTRQHLSISGLGKLDAARRHHLDRLRRLRQIVGR
ncbi:transporter [Klebsiella michiganensis]|nr:transporter [Klebsiella michiganensis]